ncbi:hypothetical protein [Streptococcus sinensis]|uniref:Uncharacterized protein n=1 Tax=Streptococcus sinensis TaxID=176090 RepID=A0A0A0DCL3_9STRE|nr:hypothetical protein [Streptococcus sinensis]KGM36401.1 hypothetical protein SSIN_1758 [Streptococcus sinensis]
MALTDEKMQELQVNVLDIIKESDAGKDYTIPRTNHKYRLINEVNETTQAIAFAGT